MGQIRFILGRAGTGKTTHCVQAAASALLDGGGEPLILLTPEQATYQMERAVLARPGVAGFSRLRVLSFNRLAFWLNRRLGSAAELSRLGRQMAVHRVLLQQAEQLELYRNTAGRLGLAEKLSGLLTELQQADCTPQQIAALARQLQAAQPGTATARKWLDIARIYAEYAAFFEDTSTDLQNPEAQLTQARRDIAEAAFVNGAHIWVDGFSGFTVQEREMLIEMARHCKTMRIALCLDPARLDLENTDPNLLDPTGLFYTTECTYAELLGIFRTCRFAIETPQILSDPLRYATAPALAHLEAALACDIPSAPARAANGAVEIACCGDLRGEAEWTAGRICELVRQKGYRYRDIAVAAPEMEQCGPYLESAFARHGIPCFLDRPAAVRHHPLAETLQAALAAAEGFETMDILCYLKSGLTGLAGESINRLERYCLTYGIERDDWTDAAAWQFAAADQPDEDGTTQQLRQTVVAPLTALHEAVFANDEPLEAAAFVRAVWALLERIEARETLALWARHDPTDTQGHRQIWTQLTAVLDQMQRVFAGRPEPVGVFVSVLTEALSSLTIKLIPPTLDQVLIGSIERSRHPDVRAMFLIGATQKQFPTPLSTTDILGRHERRAAQDRGLELPDTLSRQLCKRHYLAYIALTRASEYLAISFAQQDEKGSPVVPSVWIDRLAALFTDVRPRPAGIRQSPLQSQNAADLAERLAAACGKDRPPMAQTDAAAFVLHQAMASAHPTIRQAARQVFDALTYTNTAELTSEATRDRLKRISAFSASRLGTFAACPYQHFAKYVLKLDKRPLLRFEPVDMGSFYHAVIERLFRTLQQHGVSWATAPPEQLQRLSEQSIQEAIAENATMSAFTRRQMHRRYIIERACEVLRGFIPALAELERAGAFRQAAAEQTFTFELDKTIRLTGYIDRVDIAERDGQKIAAVFDYKLSPRSLNWTKMMAGLDVQLLTYLLAVPSLTEQVRADAIAGAFYLPIETGGKTVTPDAVAKEQDKFACKATGIFNGAFVETLDRDAHQWSRYYNFYVGKDGQPYGHYKTSGAIQPADFETLLTYARRLIADLAGGIRSGTIAARPYRLGKVTPCAWCDYKSVCRFDWQINDYNILETFTKEQVFEKMKGNT